MLYESYNLFTINVPNSLQVLSESYEYLQMPLQMLQMLANTLWMKLLANIFFLSIIHQHLSSEHLVSNSQVVSVIMPRGANRAVINTVARESPTIPFMNTETLFLMEQYPMTAVASSDNQRTNGPVNAHLISWPSKAINIQNLENIW